MRAAQNGSETRTAAVVTLSRNTTCKQRVYACKRRAAQNTHTYADRPQAAAAAAAAALRKSVVHTNLYKALAMLTKVVNAHYQLHMHHRF
jgi:hypothetical protein